ncbi:MAG: UPF0261 family protein [Dethiobacter sp.]|jgi:uncharacterized protein (UPF0261 family)|nr:MAG: UPF0261 family protein [Dethiobacter sp.]
MIKKTRKTIVLLGTLDTKGIEIDYIREKVVERGHQAILVDVSMLNDPLIKPDIGWRQVLAESKTQVDELAHLKQEDRCLAMIDGAINVIQKLYYSGKLDGIISLGGSVGTSLAASVMRTLPLGIPKVIVSTVASGNVRHYVGATDIVMIPSVIDIWGLNHIAKRLLAEAAGAIVGMVEMDSGSLPSEKPLIAVSVRGVIPSCVSTVKRLLEVEGFEVVCFHAVGQGVAMEEWVEQGLFAGVLDLVPVELTEQLFGGIFSAGPHRLESAGRKGIPQLIVPGCIGFICFQREDDIPVALKDRKRRAHNPNLICVWPSKEEMTLVAKVMAEKLNKAIGPTAVIIPMKGFAGEGWDMDPETILAFTQTLTEHLKPEIEFIEVDAHINDTFFAEKVAALFIKLFHEFNRRRKALCKD